MSRPVANVLRVATIVVFVAVAVLAVRAFTAKSGGGPEVAEVRAGELPVDRAIALAPERPVAVRGYVFDGPGGLGLRLCNGRQRTSPPLCLGPYLDLDGVNEGSFSLESGTTDAGRVRWVEGTLALRGTVSGTRLAVAQVLR